MQNFEDQIKEELIKNSYENLTKGNAWEFFKKSNYYKHLQNEQEKFRKENNTSYVQKLSRESDYYKYLQNEETQSKARNTICYAKNFLSDMKDLNLIEPECFNQ